MHRIDLLRLRVLLQHQLYRTTAVRTSVLGGWFVRRSYR